MKQFSKDRVNGFLHAKGAIMVNGQEEEVILRGWGMGNWNNPEGFLLGGGNFFDINFGKEVVPAGRLDRGRSFSQIIKELCGTAYEEGFWKEWYGNYLSEDDIKILSEEGYNSVRLPICARTFLMEEPGIHFAEVTFLMLNQVLDWCDKYHIYAIIDMHAAVGAQSCLPCDDGVDNMPHLFLDEESEERTILLCEELAKRFSDREIIGAYNLINEPLSNPAWFHLTGRLQQFYQNLVKRMRVFDKNHMFLLEAYHFSSKLDIFDKNYDEECNNWGISIHCYEQRPEVATFFHALEKREGLQVPIWMGETGGSNRWMTSLFELLVEYHIGFNVWCFKTCQAADAAKVLEFTLPKEWELVRKYALEGAGKPSFEKSQSIFNEYLDNVVTDKCHHNKNVHQAVLRKAGCVVPAVAYNDKSIYGEETAAFYGTNRLGNAFKYRIGDHMRFTLPEEQVSGITIFGNPRPDKDWAELELKLEHNEYASYTVRDVKKPTTLKVFYRATNNSKLIVSIDNQQQTEVEISASQGNEIELGELPCLEELQVKITVSGEAVILKDIIF